MAMLALFGVGFWLLVLRPAKAKQAQQQSMVNQLKTGDKIMTTAGLFGYVVELSDDEVGIEIADGVSVRMVRAAIARVVPAIDITDDAVAEETGDEGSIERAVDVTEVEAAPGSGPTATN